MHVRFALPHRLMRRLHPAAISCVGNVCSLLSGQQQHVWELLALPQGVLFVVLRYLCGMAGVGESSACNPAWLSPSESDYGLRHHCDHCSVRASLSALISFPFAHLLGFASLVHGHPLRSLSGIIPLRRRACSLGLLRKDIQHVAPLRRLGGNVLLPESSHTKTCCIYIYDALQCDSP